ncbi:MAG: maleylacetoacetate isomerase [Parvularculaceae bacterium]|nr:maleylacetoacetate isomerase [Amphiplicatus sp.]MCB9956035.1 maleylacetoacetate isomerase [Caulobacterales bacterium]
MKLLGYWRSSATYRVRIALALKGLDYDYQPVNLLKGEQSGAEYLKKNPQALVPTLVTDAGEEISQSLAIIEFLQETFPSPSVLPKTPILRAKARAIAAAIACEAQPFANLRIQKYLTETLGVSDEAKAAFLNRWPGGALNAVEAMACETAGAFCVGDEPTIADAFLVPQIFASRRFNIDLSNCPTLLAIDERCQKLPAFIKAHPDNQPDAVKG